MSWLEIASVAFALAYLVLAIRQNILCWAAALISTLLSLVLFYDARLYPETALQVFYAVMAVYGWYQWRHGGRPGERVRAELPVSIWPLRYHALAIGGTLAAALALGTLLSRTNAAFPYLDSFTSVGAVDHDLHGREEGARELGLLARDRRAHALHLLAARALSLRGAVRRLPRARRRRVLPLASRLARATGARG